MSATRAVIGNAVRRTVPCRFCDVLSAPQPKAFWDSPIVESSNFVIVPSLGSMREGWLLIVPKEHFIAAASLPNLLAAEILEMKRLAKELLRPYESPVWCFEHGPASEKRAVGCGVDHAHIHVVPFEHDLISAANGLLPDGSTFQPGTLEECKTAARAGADYLYAEDPSGQEMVAFGANFGSQVFRRAIAAVDGKPLEYDWRQHPHFDNVRATVARLAVQRPRKDDGGFAFIGEVA
jgi:ATP adenylyltransferase